MDKKFYKETIDSIRISDEAVKKALKNVRLASDTVGKVEAMTKKKHRYFKPVGVIAASLVLVLAIGIVLDPFGMLPDENGFSIITYAAEKDIKIGEDNVQLDKVNVTNTEMQSDPVKDEYSFKAALNFDVKAEGKDIKSISYKIENAFFLLEKNNKLFVSKSGEGDRNIDLGSETSYKGVFDSNYDAYEEFSVDYNNQPERLRDENGFLYSKGPVLIYLKANEQDGAEMKKLIKAVCGVVDEDELSETGIQPLREIYEKLINSVKITVTAKYKDGREEKARFALNIDSESSLNDAHDIVVNIRNIY